jgi:hypothetical protein
MQRERRHSSGRHYRREGRERYQVMTLATHEFIRRFLIHALPAGGGGQRCRTSSGGNQRAFQEAALFGVKIVEQLLAVELKFRARAIIDCRSRSEAGLFDSIFLADVLVCEVA